MAAISAKAAAMAETWPEKWRRPVAQGFVGGKWRQWTGWRFRRWNDGGIAAKPVHVATKDETKTLDGLFVPRQAGRRAGWATPRLEPDSATGEPASGRQRGSASGIEGLGMPQDAQEGTLRGKRCER